MVSKLVRLVVVFIIVLISVHKGFAQTDTTRPLRIAVLVPLYIDSAFTGDEYTAGSVLPTYMMPGLDFYNGVMLAVDSLRKENVLVEVWIYDTKKDGGNMDSLEKEMKDKNFSLILASISSAVEQQSLGSFAFNNNIPFISGTYPNDAGLITNPFFAIVNSTLKTHAESIYKYVQRNYIGDKVYYVTRKGGMEQRIKNYFDGMRAKTATLKYDLITMPDNFTADALLSLIDTAAESVVICGSLDKSFGANLLHVLSTASSSNQLTAVGMPTWDGMDALYSQDCKNVNIVFSTPYNFKRSDKIITAISDEYHFKFNSHPTDMVFKGFEQMYHFTHLLVKYRDSLFSHLSDTSFKIANQFNFQPVRLSPSSYAPDYLENKKLYFIKMLNGNIKSVD